MTHIHLEQQDSSRSVENTASVFNNCSASAYNPNEFNLASINNTKMPLDANTSKCLGIGEGNDFAITNNFNNNNDGSNNLCDFGDANGCTGTDQLGSIDISSGGTRIRIEDGNICVSTGNGNRIGDEDDPSDYFGGNNQAWNNPLDKMFGGSRGSNGLTSAFEDMFNQSGRNGITDGGCDQSDRYSGHDVNSAFQRFMDEQLMRSALQGGSRDSIQDLLRNGSPEALRESIGNLDKMLQDAGSPIHMEMDRDGNFVMTDAQSGTGFKIGPDGVSRLQQDSDGDFKPVKDYDWSGRHDNRIADMMHRAYQDLPTQPHPGHHLPPNGYPGHGGGWSTAENNGWPRNEYINDSQTNIIQQYNIAIDV